MILIPGIWGIISEGKLDDIDLTDAFHNENSISYLINKSKFNNAIFGRHSISKFVNDKVFDEYNNLLFIYDGVIFNLRDLFKIHTKENLVSLFFQLYTKFGWEFIRDLRGNFAGLIYDPKNLNLIIFTDHLASKPVYYFYHKNSKTLIFASELKVVVEGMKRYGFSPQLDLSGAYCLLTFGYMLGDLTLVHEIKKLPPGNVLVYTNGTIELREYYRLSSEPYIEGNKEEILLELDQKFKYAVQLEYQKDLEYNYNHLSTLSGGLDSRVNIAYAKKLNFKNITCFTFSQNGYLDETISKAICSDNHFEFLFYSLNNGDYLIKNLENIVSSNDGLILYLGSSHMYNCLRKLSLNNFGLIHTGVMAGGVMGAYLDNPSHQKSLRNTWAYSNKLFNNVSIYLEIELSKYENSELFHFHNRGINGIFNGYRMIEQFTEFSSPALNVDFLDYAIKIHPKYRYKEAIYLEWIKRYTPEFSDYKWEKYGLPPKYHLSVLKMYKAFNFLAQKVSGLYEKNCSMNPIDYWWNENKTLQNYINDIFEAEIQNLEDSPDMISSCKNLFNKGSFLEKTQVITLLKAVNVLGLKIK